MRNKTRRIYGNFQKKQAMCQEGVKVQQVYKQLYLAHRILKYVGNVSIIRSNEYTMFYCENTASMKPISYTPHLYFLNPFPPCVFNSNSTLGLSESLVRQYQVW